MSEAVKKVSNTESSIYAAGGASSSKAGLHDILGAESHSTFFCKVCDDAAGDDDYWSLLHADGAGTKSIVAYLAFRETEDPAWFKGIAQDCLVMNLDDLICVNAFEGLIFNNTINRNRFLIPDSVLGVIIDSYKELIQTLADNGVEITLCGGETGDLGDIVRTAAFDATMFARVRKDRVIDTKNIVAGDCIVGLASGGQASYENTPNSGIGSNGFSLARHALIAPQYPEKYPEILDDNVDKKIAYQGKMGLFDEVMDSGMRVVDLMLSPTRSYAPVIKRIAEELGSELHGVIHCSGGGQTKIIKFGERKSYIKDNLFEAPTVFQAIQASLDVPWEEMYSVFNMGHRMEVVCDPKHQATVVDIATEYQIDAQRIGYVEDGGEKSSVTIKSPHGTFNYE